MVGTIEPRKQQVRLLEILNRNRKSVPELNELKVDLFGSLHPACSHALAAAMRENQNIFYHNYVSDEEIELAYSHAWFSAFPSRNEGYGLPIVESLRRGVPCLTANFGSMAEVAEGGGCLTVNVLDDNEICRALVELSRNGSLRRKLLEETKKRAARSWEQYADDMLDHMCSSMGAYKSQEETFRNHLRERLRDVLAGQTDGVLSLSNIQWVVSLYYDDMQLDDIPSRMHIDRHSHASIAYVRDNYFARDEFLTSRILNNIASADIIITENESTINSITNALGQKNVDILLPQHLFSGEAAIDFAVNAAVDVSKARSFSVDVAHKEMAIRVASSYYSSAFASESDLAIVISTYNRAPFVEMNVEWILHQIDKEQCNVQCIVVDNASTDDTHERLARFLNHPAFSYQCNPSNVGMLGNLRVCAGQNVAKYLWIIGDDDFISEGAISRTVDAIKTTPGLPLLIHNFGVYFRTHLAIIDSPKVFRKELLKLAETPQPTGIRQLNRVAEEHDNLFTAIYPLIFRSDVAAACFNFTFDGIPFNDLIECVPTTAFILRTLRYCDVMWFEEAGIVGNAHNSWSMHRPRWHLVIMPMIFNLAREAGVDSAKLWKWAQMHVSLFYEAAQINIQNNAVAHISLPADLIFASRFFRQPIILPEGFLCSDSPSSG